MPLVRPDARGHSFKSVLWPNKWRLRGHERAASSSLFVPQCAQRVYPYRAPGRYIVSDESNYYQE